MVKPYILEQSIPPPGYETVRTYTPLTVVHLKIEGNSMEARFDRLKANQISDWFPDLVGTRNTLMSLNNNNDNNKKTFKTVLFSF